MKAIAPLASILLLLSPYGQTEVTAGTSIDHLMEFSLEELGQIDVVTAAKGRQPIFQAPSSVYVVTRQQIKERGYRNLADILRDAPGFDFHSYSGETFYNQVSLRGFRGSNKFILMENGIRIASPTGEPVPIADNYPIHHLKQVEIVYGPASALYGADAFSGVINLIRETAQTGSAVTATAGAGSNTSRFAQLHMQQAFDNTLAIDFVGSWWKSAGDDLARHYPESYQLDDLQINNVTIVAAEDRAAYFGDHDSWTAQFHFDWDNIVELGVREARFEHPSHNGTHPISVDYGADARWLTHLSNYYLRWQALSTEALDIDVLLDRHVYEIDEASKFSNVFSGFTDAYKYALGEADNASLDMHWQINPANKLITGLSYTDYYSIPKTADLPAPYNPRLEPNDQNHYYPNTDDTLEIVIFETRYTNRAAFAQWEKEWFIPLRTTLGVRHDDYSNFGSTTNPRLGLVFQANSELTIKALYGEAFLQPSPLFSYETFGSFSGTQNADGLYEGGFFRVPNPLLQPETVKTFEMAMQYRPSPQKTFHLAAYRSDAEKLIAPQLTASVATDFVPGGIIAATDHNANIGQALVYGVDTWLDIQHRLSRGILKTWFNASYVDGELEFDGSSHTTHLPYTSPHKLRVGLSYHADQRWTVSPSVRWTDRTYSPKFDPDDASKLDHVPGYWVMDLYASAQLTDKAGISLRINNLFDREHYSVGGTSSAALRRSPQDLRSVMISFDYTIDGY